MISKRLTTAGLVAVATALFTANGTAMAPMARPEGNPDIQKGRSAPFVGEWSIYLPTREVGLIDTNLAICALPVRIGVANETHIFYLGPRDTELDAAIEMIADGDGTSWVPIAGGPSYFAIFVDADNFYLYEAEAADQQDWSQPYLYRRCP